MKRIAVAPGDPAGIGYEITVKALDRMSKNGALNDTVSVLYGDARLLARSRDLFAPELALTEISTAEAAADTGKFYVVGIDSPIGYETFKPGELSAECALCAHRALMRACLDVKCGLIDGICTGPIHKGAMRLAHVDDIGHTEMLARAFHAPNPLTLFITRELRIFFYSRHLSLRQAIDALDEDKLVEFAEMMNHETKRLGFDHPRFAMAALNPHASDGGQFGTEEAEILIPAARRIRDQGIDITDPIGADSVFAQAAAGRFDAVMSLYHDQGHIAAKTYDFDATISATLGLPCLRTSVDHGTAFDIAWQGTAQAVSMQTALENLLRYM